MKDYKYQKIHSGSKLSLLSLPVSHLPSTYFPYADNIHEGKNDRNKDSEIVWIVYQDEESFLSALLNSTS